MPQTMRAMAMARAGAPSELAPVELPVPEPGEGQVRVHVHAAAVNPADHKIVTGQFAGRFLHAREFPLVPGYDFSGIVDAVGAGVEDIGVGDAVFGHLPYSSSNRQGSFAQFVTAPVAEVGRKPTTVDHDTAAAAATAGLTALQGMRDHGRLRAGGRALIIGASGGVGSLAVAIAKRLDAEVTAVVSTHAVELARELGADDVVDRTQTDFRSLDPRFDLVFDVPAAYSYGHCRHLLAPGGTYLTTLPSPSLLLGKLATLFSSKRATILVVQSRRADLEQLGAWLADGLPLAIDERHPVREAATAIERIARGQKRGRVVIDVEGGF